MNEKKDPTKEAGVAFAWLLLTALKISIQAVVGASMWNWFMVEIGLPTVTPQLALGIILTV